MRTLLNIGFGMALVATLYSKNYIASIWVVNTIIWYNLYQESNK